MQRWTPAYIGLGSNLDDPQHQIRLAFEALAAMAGSRLVARSSAFRSAPMGPQNQPAFINAVAGVLTVRTASELLSDLQALERQLGRRPSPTRWGPRRIDLDLLWFGGQQIDDEGLTVPHPGIAERSFVVYPLAQVAPELVLPDGTRLAMLRRQMPDTGLQEISETGELPRGRGR